MNRSVYNGITGMLCLSLIVISECLIAQNALKPGFDKAEFLNLFVMSGRQIDTPFVYMPLPEPQAYKMTYRSPSVGLMHRWDLWEAPQRPPVISIRGSTPDKISWIGNFYSAMLPAQGVMRLNTTQTIPYKICSDTLAALHAGWLTGAVALSNDIFSRIEQFAERGQKEFYLVGHSQGGAIAFILNAWIRQKMYDGELPADLVFKTYSSATPKPGNLYFAYDFELKNQGGWAYTILHPDDWVPETPAGVQQINDFNPQSPFGKLPVIKKNTGALQRVMIDQSIKKLNKHPRKAARQYRKYLGRLIQNPIKKHLPDYTAPDFLTTVNYARVGNSIILKPDAAYYNRFSKMSDDIFIHHFHEPYYYLAKQLPDFIP